MVWREKAGMVEDAWMAEAGLEVVVSVLVLLL